MADTDTAKTPISSPGKSPSPDPANPHTPQSAAGLASPLGQKLASNPRQYWLLVAFLVILSALGSFVNDMFSPALPAMTKFFGCPVPLVQMGLTMGMIGLSIGQITLGPLSDKYGRKPVLVGSVALFIVAAVASVFSPSIHFFNICRLFQGIGASGGYFLARTIPADVYQGRNLARLMAVVGAINGFAPASAPVLGGVTADAFGWKGIFVVLAVFAVLVLCLSPLLKESLAVSARTQGKWWKSVSGYKELLKNRPFMIHVSFKGTALGLLFAYISSSPFILETHYGLSQTLYGVVVGVNAIFVAAGSMVALRFRLLKRAGVVGAYILAAATAAQAVALWTVHSLWVFEVCMVTMLFALGMIFTVTNTLAMNEGRGRAGEASAVLGVAGYIVGAVVAPLVGIGNILHSTAIAFVVVTVVTLICAVATERLAPDLDR